MRILDKYLTRELFATFFAVLSVLLLITFGTEATKLLTIAVEGSMPSSILFQVLLTKIPPALEVILPLVALLSVMLAVGRLYQDQEMVVLQSCGIGAGYFKRRVFWFLLPLALVTAWVSLWLIPWSYSQERILIEEAQVSSPLAALVPGKFNPLSSGGGVFYMQSLEEDGTMHSVWVRMRSEENDVLLMAPVGRFEWVEERLALVLYQGYSYEALSSDQPLIVRTFERFEGFIPELQTQPARQRQFEKETSLLLHSNDPTDMALLQWRLVTPVSIVVLGLLGLKMSRTGPREGRFAKVFFALVLYVIYNQLLVTFREAVANGTLSPWLGLWPVPLVFLAYGLRNASLKPAWLQWPDFSWLKKWASKGLNQ